MLTPFKPLTTVRALQSEGKLHHWLTLRLFAMFFIALVLVFLIAYEIYVRELNLWYALGLGAIGLLLGLFVFSPRNRVGWDERLQYIRAGQLDAVGIAAIGLYFGFEFLLRTALSSAFPRPWVVTGLVLASVAGTLLGRVIGTVLAIHRLSRDRYYY